MKDKIGMGALERVRDARRQMSEKFNHDPEKLIKYYIELQQNYKNRFVNLKENGKTSKRPNWVLHLTVLRTAGG